MRRGPILDQESKGLIVRYFNSDICILHDREEQILRERYYGDRTLKEVGESFGISKERVKQIESYAIRKIKSALRRQ